MCQPFSLTVIYTPYIYIVWWKNDGKTVDRFKVAIDMIQNIQAKMLTRKAFYY